MMERGFWSPHLDYRDGLEVAVDSSQADSKTETDRLIEGSWSMEYGFSPALPAMYHLQR